MSSAMLGIEAPAARPCSGPGSRPPAGPTRADHDDLHPEGPSDLGAFPTGVRLWNGRDAPVMSGRSSAQHHHHRWRRASGTTFDTDAANLFFQLIASRYEQGSVMVTSNLPFGRWGETFSDDVVAAAMIDRLVHHAEVLTLSGDSYRTRARRELLAKDRDN